MVRQDASGPKKSVHSRIRVKVRSSGVASAGIVPNNIFDGEFIITKKKLFYEMLNISNLPKVYILRISLSRSTKLGDNLRFKKFQFSFLFVKLKFF